MGQSIVNLAYLAAGILFIMGLKGLTHPRTAVRGNLLGGAGMLLAIVATLFHQEVLNYWMIILGLVVGGLIGCVMATKIAMTSMPQLVALFNGFGGAASVLVAFAELVKNTALLSTENQVGDLIPVEVLPATGSTVTHAAIVCSGLIGAVTFWGSLVAFGKLQELDFLKKPIRFNGQQWANLGLALLAALLGFGVLNNPDSSMRFFLLVVVSSILGVSLVLPIGGADMPVVIALLNSYSGLAAAATGFVITNNVLIIAGSLVGASGIVLTRIMCKAMNRSLFNVLFGVMAESGEVAEADEVYAGKVKSTSAE
ncbi:MAG: NAD(P)(+) transhydrogenase (Re/Si-specific) subunit beta, partial [Planctomycetales bacterium]